MEKFYTTEVTAKFTVHTQFDPKDAVDLVCTLVKCPAVSNVEVIGVTSNYKLHVSPMETQKPFTLKGGRWVLDES